MDSSNQRKSDAAATRKRRSSILKSQRSVRAPLSELEFNVATPPDQAKSRRVSFSRRTGVAEFEIHEATTAWKNVYEEHNKSLESSANESGMKTAPRRVAHLGGRAAHFSDDEGEAVDARASPAPPPPPAHADLSALPADTNTVQLFRLEASPTRRDVTDGLRVDFSAAAPLADDLDALRRDLQREPRPGNVSEYSIDVDFNATHFSLKPDDDDMSMTDTIRSPTVASSETQKSPVDWTTDKENIVVNPYVAPKASDNFAVSDDREDVLVFDGKKCKFQSNLDLSDDDRNLSRTAVRDDAADGSVPRGVVRVVLPARDEVAQRTVLLDGDMTMTRALPARLLASVGDDGPSRTIVYDDAAADMSVTRPVARVVLPAPDGALPDSSVQQKTLYFDDDMAVTGAVPAQILQSEALGNDSRKLCKTVIYDHSAADMSVTQAVPPLVLPSESGCVDETVLADDMAITRALPAEILLNEDREEAEPEPDATRRRTVVFSDNDGDISVTRTVPANIINVESSEVKQPEQHTMNHMTDMSLTRAVPAELIQENHRRKTIVFDADDGNVSMTEAVPAGALLAAARESSRFGLDSKSENAQRRKTIVYNSEDGDISITGVVPAGIHEAAKNPENIDRKTMNETAAVRLSPAKGGISMVEDGNVSVTQTVPSNIINAKSPEIIYQEPHNQKSLYIEHTSDSSVTKPTLADVVQEPRRRTIVFDHDDGDISMTEAVPADALMPSVFDNKPEHAERRRTLVYNNEDANISITGVVTADIVAPTVTDPQRTPEKEDSEIYSYIDSVPMASPPSPVMSRNTANSSSDYMSVGKSKASPVRPASQRATILDSLLDMSQASVEALAIEYKPQFDRQTTDSNTTLIDAMPAGNTTEPNGVPRSEGFKGDQDDERVDKDVEDIEKISRQHYGMEDIPERPAIEGSQPLPIEYKKEKHGIVCKLQHKLSELKDMLHIKEKSPRKSHAKSISYSNNTEHDKSSSLNTSIAPPASSVTLDNRSVMNYSDFRPASPEHNKTVEPEKNKTLTITLSPGGPARDKETSPERGKNASSTAGRQDCEEGFEEPEQKEQSQWTGPADDTRAILDALSDFTDTRPRTERGPSSPDRSRPDRKSMVISCEDLLREISLAQAMMKSEMQQTEELTEGSEDEREQSPPRLGGEVVKTLRFEDEDSIIEPRVLHKPAKVKSPPRRASAVIPTYDVSDHVKELVHDLIKPMADVAPQCLPDFARAEPSRGSQADDLESSQIDLVPSRPVLIEPRRASRMPEPESEPEPEARHSEMRVDVASPSPRKPGSREPAVIVFDHSNPLNNVLLPPVDQTEVHGYDPRRSTESLTPSVDSRAVQTGGSDARSRSVDCGMVLVTATVDRAVSIEREVKDTEANTCIAMKGNRELLAASSSLTLVDDALARSAFDVSATAGAAGAGAGAARAPLRVIFRPEGDSSVRLDSELTSCDSTSSNPHKRGHTASKGPEVTPKPAIKVQKVSSCRARRLRSLSPRSSAERGPERSPGGGPERSPGGSAEDSRASSVTVSTVAALWGCAREGGPGGEWRPELLHEPSSKNLAAEQDPGVNVVAKIDVLPFMGTSECEWESRAADTWSFRLLHGRLRLLVRLEHRACNTTRAAVRADTPVRLVLVQHTRRETDDDPVASLCLCLAAEALQRVAARGCARAGLVPALLRRGAAVARVARRWGRAMRAARLLLAFSLADDGLLSLKVANIPLRSVWEVTLRVVLCDAARGVPWPRAADVRVARVVAAWAPPQPELRRLLDPVPEDWGHVPRTVWKVFKYLKHKQPEDELLAE